MLSKFQATSNGIPMQKRNWLRQYRQLNRLTLSETAERTGISVPTFRRLEVGGGLPLKIGSCVHIVDGLGIKLALLFYLCDEDGRLVQGNSIPDIMALYAAAGFKSILDTPSFISLIFNDELTEHIMQNAIEG